MFARRIGLALACAGACRAPEGGYRPDLALAPSFLPNLGVAAAASAALQRGPRWEWRAEARFTDQFLDDKDVADNGLPEAGNWTQLDLGLRVDELATDADDRAHWSWRFGALGFEARGEPNIADEPGDYLGLYAGVGRFTDFGNGFSFGPEVTLVAAHGPDPQVFFPQITWGIRWCPR